MSPERRELTEDEAWKIALDDHPEWRRAWENDSLPDEIIGEDGQPMNPRLHLSIHVIIERQLAADDPPGIAAIEDELSRLGLSRHDVRHEIGRALADQIGAVIAEDSQFDAAAYVADLQDIVESHR